MVLRDEPAICVLNDIFIEDQTASHFRYVQIQAFDVFGFLYQFEYHWVKINQELFSFFFLIWIPYQQRRPKTDLEIFNAFEPVVIVDQFKFQQDFGYFVIVFHEFDRFRTLKRMGT